MHEEEDAWSKVLNILDRVSCDMFVLTDCAVDVIEEEDRDDEH